MGIHNLLEKTGFRKKLHRMNFTALDFETANRTRTSVCAIGLVRVEDGVEKKRIHQLIHPDTHFDDYFTSIHGIRESDVRNAPSFPEFWKEIRGYFGDNVVAHNAQFDIACLRESLKTYELEFPSFDYICTLRISRKINSLPRHGLDFLADHFGIELLQHHNALEDARACAKLFEIFSKKTDVSSFKKPFTPFVPQKIKNWNKKRKIHPGENPGWKSAEEYISKPGKLINAEPGSSCNQRRRSVPVYGDLGDIPFEYGDIDFSKNFSFIGELENVDYNEATSVILGNGGSISRKMRTDTDYIVVGSKFRPELEIPKYGFEINSLCQIGRAIFVSEKHFLKQFR